MKALRWLRLAHRGRSYNGKEYKMAYKVKVWFDSEGDFLEVQFSDAPGFMRPTAYEAVMERVDEHGHVLGFSVLGVSRFKKDHPLEAELMTGT